MGPRLREVRPVGAARERQERGYCFSQPFTQYFLSHSCETLQKRLSKNISLEDETSDEQSRVKRPDYEQEQQHGP